MPKRAVLVIDEAHLLPDASLEDLRLLTADSLDKKSPFALVLAGQPLLRERMTEPQHYALAQRITVRVRLRTRNDSEVALFVDKHLRACCRLSPLRKPTCSSESSCGPSPPSGALTATRWPTSKGAAAPTSRPPVMPSPVVDNCTRDDDIPPF